VLVNCDVLTFSGVPSATSRFAEDVLIGLSNPEKKVPSSWLYDAKGGKLFEAICEQPEYYPTRSEKAILSAYSAAIAKLLPKSFRLIELGAGDGSKTKLLLRQFLADGSVTEFCPIDICEDSIKGLIEALKSEFNGSSLTVQAKAADYWDGLEALKVSDTSSKPQVVLFLGSSLGNHLQGEDEQFMQRLHASLQPGDMVLLGLDLVKDEVILIPAYSDAAGVTAEFNLNLLDRMNRELGANFCKSAFRHEARYNADQSRMESHLVARYEQIVSVPKIGKMVHFREDESIHVECSIKYTELSIERLAFSSGFTVKQYFFDTNCWFTNVLLTRT
jgi:L-histidine N-alpha-methyltransferase